jgi:hypothetical protein
MVVTDDSYDIEAIEATMNVPATEPWDFEYLPEIFLTGVAVFLLYGLLGMWDGLL